MQTQPETQETENEKRTVGMHQTIQSIDTVLRIKFQRYKQHSPKGVCPVDYLVYYQCSLEQTSTESQILSFLSSPTIAYMTGTAGAFISTHGSQKQRNNGMTVAEVVCQTMSRCNLHTTTKLEFINILRGIYNIPSISQREHYKVVTLLCRPLVIPAVGLIRFAKEV